MSNKVFWLRMSGKVKVDVLVSYCEIYAEF